MRHSSTILIAAALLVGTAGVRGWQTTGPATASGQTAPAAQPSAAAGKKAYDEYCAGCHGTRAQGAAKAGVLISIIQEQGGRQPPDLTDAQWDHGSSDEAIFGVIKKGVPPTMMAGYDGRLPDATIRDVIRYLRALASHETVEAAPATTTPIAPREVLTLSDYVEMPVTGDPNGELTRGLLARVNFLRDEPGGRRFFVN
ncbi:MAG TPA: cytochrome c, partial [Luteitalea sp.]|nr:cytochrome c [Luteitalea sp.]